MSANTLPNTVLVTRSGIEVRDFDNLRPAVKATTVLALLCSAFEGGSNYWYRDVDSYKFPKGYERKDVHSGGRLQLTTDYWHWCQILPMIPGGSTCFWVKEDIPWIPGKEPATCPNNYKAQKDGESASVLLHRVAIRRGLDAIAARDPKLFGSLLGDADAGVADNFLQFCTFGEVIYG